MFGLFWGIFAITSTQMAPDLLNKYLMTVGILWQEPVTFDFQIIIFIIIIISFSTDYAEQPIYIKK